MKYAISYFYQIRYFKDNMIPFSTAVWDPKWFHNFRTQQNIFIDKNLIINGLRCEELKPGRSCDGLCRGPENCIIKDPTKCKFLEYYNKQLHNIDFNLFLSRLDLRVNQLQKQYGIKDPIVVFIVYETPDNHCSERSIIINWFKENGIDLEELKYPIEENY